MTGIVGDMIFETQGLVLSELLALTLAQKPVR